MHDLTVIIRNNELQAKKDKKRKQREEANEIAKKYTAEKKPRREMLGALGATII